MTGAAQAIAIAAAVVNLGVGLWGGWLWYRVEQAGQVVWRAIRVAQGACVVHALAAGGLYLAGMHVAGNLYALYVGLPIAVSFVAEQLRVLSADTVLDARGLENAAAVGELEPAAQRSVVTAILRRELGVMAASCTVAAFLLLRAAATV